MGSGSTWLQPGTLTIGGNAGATGTLTISNGGNVYTGGSGGTFGSTIAYNAGSSGTVNVSGVGSTWMNKGPLAVSGVGGDGVLHITSGGTVSNGNCILGIFEGSGNVTVEGVGSTWTIDGDLSIGEVFGGIGMVTISQGGRVTSTNGFIAMVLLQRELSRLMEQIRHGLIVAMFTSVATPVALWVLASYI